MKRSSFVRMAAVILSLLLLTACAESSGVAKNVKRMAAEVDDGNYVNAAMIYSNTIYGNVEQEYEADALLRERLSGAIDDYNGGAKAYEEARSVVATIERTGILSASDMEEYDWELSSLRSSKAAFDSAESLFASGLYGEALENYLSVSERDTNYEAAQQKAAEAKGCYLDELEEKLNGCLGDDDYDAALALIQRGRMMLPNETTLDAKETEIRAKYLNYVLEQAEDAFAAEGYESAIRVITSAQNKLGDNERLAAALEEYQSYIPVWLNDLEYFDSDSGYGGSLGDSYIHNHSDVTDNFGNTYKYALCLDPGWDNVWGSVRYYLGGNYSTFSGTCVTPYSDRDRNVSGYLEIYGDDVLLYTSPTMVSDSAPEPFSVDVSGVTFLKIVFSTANGFPILCDGLLEK